MDDKTAIFDIYGTTEAGSPVLIEVQQTFNKLFVDRLIYYTKLFLDEVDRMTKRLE